MCTQATYIYKMIQPFCFIIGLLLDLFECVLVYTYNVRAKRIVSFQNGENTNIQAKQ